MSYLYILDINLSRHLQILSLFPYVFSFCLWFPFLCKIKLLSLIKSHFFTFVFISFVLGDGFKKQKLLQFMSKSDPPMYSSKIFMFSGQTFRFLIHFECIFVYGVRKCSNVIDLHVDVQFSRYHLLKILSVLHCIFLPPLL